MHGREVRPLETGQPAPDPQNCGEAAHKEERPQAGPQTTLTCDTDSAIDKVNDTGKPPAAPAYSIRWLVARCGVSAAIAAIIARELGMGDAE
jgi:hypothetical protein